MKPYAKEILLLNKETGAYKIVLKNKNREYLKELQERLNALLSENLIPAIKEIEERVQQKDMEAIISLAMLNIFKVAPGVDDFNKGINLLNQAKTLGSIEPHFQMGTIYYEGINDQHNYIKAFKNFEYAATRDHVTAQYYLAACYLHGKGVKYNDAQAVY